jgi:hypothetical protein
VLWVVPDSLIEPVLEGVSSGLVGTVAMRVERIADGSVAYARTTLGIAEIAPGTYRGTVTAGLPGGNYLIVWDLGDQANADDTFSEELFVTTTPVGAPAGDWAPSIADVGGLLRIRTRDRSGNLIGTFTDATQPSGDQVQSIINSVVGELQGTFGESPVDALVPTAKLAATYKAAMLVELSYFGDQITAGRSPFAQLQALYTDAFQQFVLRRRQIGLDEAAGTEDDTSGAGMPVSVFPAMRPVPPESQDLRPGWEGVVW